MKKENQMHLLYIKKLNNTNMKYTVRIFVILSFGLVAPEVAAYPKGSSILTIK